MEREIIYFWMNKGSPAPRVSSFGGALGFFALDLANGPKQLLSNLCPCFGRRSLSCTPLVQLLGRCKQRVLMGHHYH